MILKPMSILAVDPGGSTGVAYIEIRDLQRPAVVTYSYETTGSLDDTINLYNDWRDKSELVSPDRMLVICEDWIPFETEFSTQPALAIEPMAWLKLLAHGAGIIMVTPKPQQRLAFGDDVFKSSGYWHRGGEGHARSAIRHGLSWCLRQYHMPTYEKLKPRPAAGDTV